MAIGDMNTWAMVRRVGVGDAQEEFTAHFTTAGASQPTVNTDRTRCFSVLRTGVGVYEITLPRALRNVDVQISMFAHPASAILNLAKWSFTEGAKVVTITNTVIASGAAGDTTGVGWNVRIIGKVL